MYDTFSVAYWMCGHLAVEAHNWAISTSPLVLLLHQKVMCGWQTLEIIVQGDKVEHKINGQVVRTSKASVAASRFMLRAEFGAIQIRNIRAKE